jgi:hypothetical protein
VGEGRVRSTGAHREEGAEAKELAAETLRPQLARHLIQIVQQVPELRYTSRHSSRRHHGYPGRPRSDDLTFVQSTTELRDQRV